MSQLELPLRKLDPYTEGYNAAWNMTGRNANPYMSFSLYNAQWDDGYTAGESDMNERDISNNETYERT